MVRAQVQCAAKLASGEQPRLAELAGDSPRKGAVGDNSQWEPETSLAAAARARESKGCTKEEAEAQLCAARMGRKTCQVLFQLLHRSVPISSAPAPPNTRLRHDQREAVAIAGLTHRYGAAPDQAQWHSWGWKAGTAMGVWWLCHETGHGLIPQAWRCQFLVGKLWGSW